MTTTERELPMSYPNPSLWHGRDAASSTADRVHYEPVPPLPIAPSKVARPAVPVRGYRVEVGRVAERAESIDDAVSLALHTCQRTGAPIGTPVSVTHRAGTSAVLGVWDGDA